MKLERSVWALMILSLAGMAGVSQAGECSGNACQYIQIQKRGGCIVIVNTSNRAINVRPKTTFVSFGMVYANSEFYPKVGLDGVQCATSYRYDYSAFYDGDAGGGSGGCEKVRPLRDLGWREGHKTKFCRRKGYDGVTNFPNSDYRDHGGGFCYSGEKQACLREMRGY